jgi:ADP-L-glycero-D-manno-heptose 6-epimerase
LARLAATRDVPFLYASSASVYGATTSPHGGRVEAPLNPYAASKLAVDRSLAPLMKSARASCVGLRFFNAYGPGEAHKGVMASIVDQAVRQIEATGRIRLFDRCPDAPDGRIRRDWISVEDAVDVIRFFLYGPPRHGTFDVGTGQATTFEHVAGVVIDAMATGTIESIPFPDHLRGRYQYETVADLTALRSAGYDRSFETVEDAVPRTVDAIRTRAATSTVAHG